ncbi:ABC transporter ATP-binding protein [Polyangium spumosum]|uniref:ATP-binding cassette domain-containing protein n=1 Tax=Polyangium spumosum TaxID=889282 RepID=A0A6N7PZN5_9BACT|nr:ABC transporter ATP-binding protein [Polyangium spumosum]MRG97463.1 ATP-binding cassette domain-containing protein [Polyangium spumosum]
MAAIELRGLVRRHPGAEMPALDKLDLDVEDGEMLVLVGPSGCGKSTTLRLVSGLDAPDAGTIRIGDRDVTRVAPQDRDVAMVFQGYALYPHMKVREILAFPLKMRGVSRAEREKKVGEAAELLGLSKLLDRRPGELSGGERQRVAMGRAIVRSPRVFLFDEPLSNLDAALRAELRVELASLVRRLGVTSMYVTHDQVEAMTIGDRIAVMKGGILQQVGAPKAIYEAPANVFVASFLGSPAINRIEVEPRGDKLEAPGFSLAAPAGLDLPARVVVGVRPEHVRISREKPAPENLSFSAEVVHGEPLGAETYLYLDARGTRIAARLPGWGVFSPRDHVTCAVDVRHCLFFDAATGTRLVEARG